MRRIAVILSVFVATVANAREPSLPVPPIPPAEPPSLAAPVPNLSFVGQYDEVRRSTVTLDTGINHRTAPTSGLAYSKGASYQIDNDRRWLALPGVIVRVPLP